MPSECTVQRYDNEARQRAGHINCGPVGMGGNSLGPSVNIVLVAPRHQQSVVSKHRRHRLMGKRTLSDVVVDQGAQAVQKEDAGGDRSEDPGRTAWLQRV